ncbi:MAG: hypothetical protein UU32_C0037G0009 [Candidatus Woesebacteria bacterium GW2011_GWB1_41_10]|uniref:Fimbrial assembly family protein n=1 Tax=Candidatus Woesebacteria bacterium GW2011_GWB1_41_10 TaxID=1618577 RepID=A0A0G0WL43_9BACT|nr:MAG: hypothetical protein UU32_C0037G0009 [Candidatus Woesebacteria bacterium GW2011_GWB1_41_10]
MINLLPPELKTGGIFGKAIKAVRSLTLILLSLFLVFGFGVAGFFILSSIELRNLTANGTSLKEQIKVLEVTEQKMVLLKDRIGKIRTAMNSPSVISGFEGVNLILSSLSSDSSVSELAVDSTKIDLSLAFRSPGDLSGFLTNLKNSTFFKSIVLTSFGFNPQTGYLVAVRLMPKS